MAMSRLSNDVEDDDEYIEMEVNSYSKSFYNSSITSSPQHSFPIEFEFQMSSSSSVETEPPTTSPADELFYKGKLLPLHLPPRLQMVEKLLNNSNSTSVHQIQDYVYWTPLMTTPFESYNVSPSQSCRELNPEECFFQYSTEALSCRRGCEVNRKKSSSSLAIGSKLKAYKAYLKSLFSKTSCSSESCSAAKVADEGSMLKVKEIRVDRMMKSTKKAPFGEIRNRRSSSSAIERHHSTNKCSSSSTSSSSSSGSSLSQSSNGVEYLQFLKRSNSVNVEIESPIQGAIAHCKQSQQLIRSSKIVRP